MDIEPLLVRLDALAPSFGRAQGDIHAMVSRGRSEDYKGVMQNCRLVLEALLRALVSDQLKQTPGKAMLDELITKFRQQANAGVIPTNVLAHMGTVQAWGNLSSHDHATKLSDTSVKVGKLEVMASLNSMVAILEWYSETFGGGLPKPADAASARPTVSLGPRPVSKGPALVPIALGVVVLAGIGGYFATRPAAAVVSGPQQQPGSSFVALDALYSKWDEPSPPAACRSSREAATLANNSGDLTALEALPQNRSAEAWYVIARAQAEQKIDANVATQHALACSGFAAALNLAGKIAIRENRLADALPHFKAALDAAPKFQKARFNLAVLHMKEQRIADGIGEMKKVIAENPKDADANFLLGVAYEGQSQAAEAKVAFCAAFDNGKAEAKDRCGR